MCPQKAPIIMLYKYDKLCKHYAVFSFGDFHQEIQQQLLLSFIN